uniref:Uncharacterized protein n=1 Tax=Arundo donax TaxID=35708 RepID=A0A0A9G598_ARUDO
MRSHPHQHHKKPLTRTTPEPPPPDRSQEARPSLSSKQQCSSPASP